MKKEKSLYALATTAVILSMLLSACGTVEGSETSTRPDPNRQDANPAETATPKPGIIAGARTEAVQAASTANAAVSNAASTAETGRQNVEKALMGNGNIPTEPPPTPGFTPEYLQPVAPATREPGLRGQPATTAPSSDCVEVWSASKTGFSEQPKVGARTFASAYELLGHFGDPNNPNNDFDPNRVFWYQNGNGESMLITGQQIIDNWKEIANQDTICKP